MSQKRVVFACLLAAALLGAGGHLPGAEPPPAKREFVNARGGTYRLPGPEQCKAIVLVFIGHDCPISNSYSPEVARLCKEYGPKKVAFCVVYADSDITRAEAAKHAKDYGFTCPAVLDPKMTLALAFGATVKPEAVVLSPQRKRLYLGRIDNLYADFGKKRPRPTQRDLRETLDAVLAGKPVPVARTRAIGCDIDLPEKK